MRPLLVPVPAGFDFERTVRSHGWYDLPPFSWDAAQRRLGRVFLLSSRRPVGTTVRATRRGLAVSPEAGTDLPENERAELARQVRSCFRLDEDLDAFHRAARRYPEFRWIAAAGAGRMLRAPTVFEDVIRMICTTNCSWSLTVVMITNLVEAFGAISPAGAVAFPAPAALAATTESLLRKEIRTGYRSPYLLELASHAASGRLDVEAWRTSTRSTTELYEELCGVKGIGPYAAGNLLKLLGRYEHLGLDSWVRARYAELHARGRKVSDRTIERRYRRYGEWRGLFFWLEMTRSWHERKFRRAEEEA